MWSCGVSTRWNMTLMYWKCTINRLVSDPKRLAVWTLERFAPRLSEYVHEVYDQMDHPALGQSPREAFEQGMTLAGSRTHTLIPYSEDFLMLTRPSTATGTVKIHPSRGITVNGLHYWHYGMRSALVSGQTVPVRYEPFDIGFVYAYIGGQWLQIIAHALPQVPRRSRRDGKPNLKRGAGT